jgi:predicted O-methyltransferase YrrM
MVELYREHVDGLRVAREEQLRLARIHGDVKLERYISYRLWSRLLSSVGLPAHYKSRIKPQLDDVEAELTYLLIRAFRPDTVVELAPDRGWSTTWILRALRDNGRGHLHSYDLVDYSTHTVPSELAAGRWTFTQGDIRNNLDRLPESIDFFFMDAVHKAFFAEWYLEHIFDKLAPGTTVEVHDVFQQGDPQKYTEGPVLLQWLKARGIPWFTAAPAARPDVFAAIDFVRQEVGFTRPLHGSRVNPMLFFIVR